MRKTIAMAMLILTVFILSGCKKEPAVKVGDVLPEVRIQDLDGKTVGLPGDFQGKVAAVLFYEPGCPYCMKEMPKIEPLYQELKDSGFVFAAVQLADDKKKAMMMVKKNNLTFPMLFDPKGLTKKRYGVVFAPTMFVVGRDSTVKEKVRGGLGAKDLEKVVKELL
jgi:peroxiredoxin